MSSTQQIRSEYDAIIVGARCAGAATAMLLARAGQRVLAVDRSPYGSDMLSTHALMRGGVQQLHRWGLLDRLKAEGTPTVRSTSFHYGDEFIKIPIMPRGGIEGLYGPRRTVLDRLLVDAAREAGAQVVHRTRAIELVRSVAGRVEGAVIQTSGGSPQAVRAGIVIGADGLRSLVAELVGAESYRVGRHATATIYGYWTGLDVDGYHWYFRPGVSCGLIPTNGGVCLFASLPSPRFREERGDGIEAIYHRVLQQVAPGVEASLRGAQRVGSLRGFAGEVGLLRRSAGSGWALVGDAGFFRDPLTSHGITDALRDAELLARAVVRGEDELACYPGARDEFAVGMLEVTDEIASFAWDLEQIKGMHKRLSREMNREVEMLSGLDSADAGKQEPSISPRQKSPRQISPQQISAQ
jgi:2-polyprenyl-6-methoxyphenol hydroxylase-like FAD-dependent oxidoreductase